MCFFFKQKTAYEMRISDLSSDVCSSDLAILARLRERAQELGVPSCVVIFEPQPREFFAPDTAPARLARLRDKLHLLAAEGVDRVLCLAFNQRLSRLSAAEFVETILVGGLDIKRSEERPVGKEWVSTCRSWWWPNNK